MEIPQYEAFGRFVGLEGKDGALRHLCLGYGGTWMARTKERSLVRKGKSGVKVSLWGSNDDILFFQEQSSATKDTFRVLCIASEAINSIGVVWSTETTRITRIPTALCRRCYCHYLVGENIEACLR